MDARNVFCEVETFELHSSATMQLFKGKQKNVA
jgi:hypothetical protein